MPQPEFEGVVGDTFAQSTPHWPEPPHPGEQAPNVVVILLDDLGFSHFGCFGSSIETPNINALAGNGLRYTNFHVTPLCSPTRAALLTGRNQHEVGMRSVSNFNTGFQNMRGQISNHAATVAEVLRDRGYTTFALGKWHLCPMENASAAGPFDQWPCQRGFDRFYGFMDGETDQFHPELVYDNHHVDPPSTPDGGYHVSEDLVDRAIGFIHDAKSVRPDRPFFTYLAFGATHAPHQAPQAYLDKYRGRFDEGWDVARAEWFARQQEMGLLPPETVLAPRNPGVEAWDEMPETHRRLAARLQEAFAAFLDHTDAQIGRLMADLERLGELDNTVIMVLSDNGASQEGGPFGVMHEMKFFNLILETPDEAIVRIDDIGSEHGHTNYPWGWAQAGNTPFRWYKQNTHEGGVHVPLVVHWPAGIDPAHAGTLRDQFHHVNDIAPTIYEILNIEAPAVYRGLEQIPITGTSMRYSFDQPAAPTHKAVQYYEMHGHRAIITDGWKAVTRHQPGVALDDDTWELYHLAEDRSECNDLAESMPDKLAELVALWWVEAREHGVLPIDDRGIELFGGRSRAHGVHRPDRHYTYRPPIASLPSQASASIAGRSWDLDAVIDRPAGAQGVLFATGTANSGVSLFIQNDRLVFDYNIFGAHHVLDSTAPVPVGPSVVGVRFRRRSGGGDATLVIDGQDSGTIDLPFVMRMISSIGPSIGNDHGSTVSNRYAGPFPFEGHLDRVDIQLVERSAAPDQGITEARAAMGRQ
ncbi:MAG: sulfatase-like hydrolase/transferase [Actinobacteria bacterium]|nr:sulfatase-like hydrolase/transferase [Actinomycetota bacterium]